jgi:ketosteroid isomerase-like protein
MRKIAAVLPILFLASFSVAASDEADVMAIAHHWSASFGSGDSKAINSICAADAVVIDDFPPHVWQGSSACARWYKDFETFAAKANTTDAKIVVEKATHLEIAPGYAYLVAPVTLSFNRSGKPVTETGVLAMSLHKGESGWLITGFAWADQ